MPNARFRFAFALLLLGLSAIVTACGSVPTAVRSIASPTVAQTPAVKTPDVPTPAPTVKPLAPQTQDVPTQVPSPAKTGFDACSLVTQAEIEAALGDSVQMPSSGTTMYGAARCYYNGVTIYSSAAGIELVDGSNAATDFARHAQDNPQQTAVAGLGDKAFWNDKMLWVLRGDHELSILLLKAKSGSFITSLDSTETVAKLALGRLAHAPLPPLNFQFLEPPVTP